jgi:protein-glutamine gamma-glutamyltransferase
LFLPDRRTAADYELSWWEPVVDDLSRAAIDGTARTGLGDLGEVPAGVADLAHKAVQDTRPAFQTALVLERFLRENYTLATGADQPSGIGWPQLSTFLLDTKRGTTEQFAAAYVVPVAWAVRGRARRRRPGARAVVGAWAEARDRLRAGLARKPWQARLRAALNLRSLLR